MFTKINKYITYSASLIIFICSVNQASASLVNLTGVNLYSSDLNGNSVGGHLWDTEFGGSWILGVEDVSSGVLLNTSSGSNSEDISYSLNAGTYSFNIYANYSNLELVHAGLGLFFNGTNNANISAVANLSTESFTSALTNIASVPVLGDTGFSNARGLIYEDANVSILLKNFTMYMFNDITPVDKVSIRNATPGNGLDNFGLFTLEVSDKSLTPAVVPVPASVWLLGSGIIGLLGMRKNKSKA